MSESPLPTASPEALMSFVQGRSALAGYLATGRAEDLVTARERFSVSHRSDPAFHLAAFFLAIASTELRESEAAIEILKALIERPIPFLPEALLQLAYAYTKTYESAAFLEAEEALDRALDHARNARRDDIVPLIRAYQVFLYAVMGGRFDELSERPRYIGRAIALGEALLTDPAVEKHPAREQILFEIENALGIAYWRKGQRETPFSAEQAESWRLAHARLDQALRLRPTAARAMQNLGSLLLTEGDQLFSTGSQAEAFQIWWNAREMYRSALALNSADQFPHFKFATASARLGDWEGATRAFQTGRPQPGAVKETDWNTLNRALLFQDAAALIEQSL